MHRDIRLQLSLLTSLIALLWAIEIVDFVLPGTPFDAYGIRPRSIGGLPGILLAPFLHGGFGHLLANTFPLLILGWLVMLHRTDDFVPVFLTSALVAGAGSWLFGSPFSIHIGASGVIFGLLGFLLLRGFFDRSIVSVLLATVAAVLYGGLLFSLLPVVQGVSWSGHFFGFIGGGVAARNMR